MAAPARRRPQNTTGDFYVDTTCIDCDLCRQIAPHSFGRAGEQSAVLQQPDSHMEVVAALEALVTCPVGSIGAMARHDIRPVLENFPKPIESGVHFCGFASESSFGAASYLIVRPQGNVLVDSPRFASHLVRGIEAQGGIHTIFLTHRDDVADHAKWARRFGAERVLHRNDYDESMGTMERLLDGSAPVPLGEGLLAIPTPGHTRGHMVLLSENRFLFSGDHVWWSPSRNRLYASPDVCWDSWDDQVRSMQRLLEFRFEWVLPGHGRRMQASPGRMRAALEDCIDAMQGRRG